MGKTIKLYAVMLYDTREQDFNKEYMAITRYRNLETLNITRNNNDYGLTLEKAKKLLLRYKQQIEKKHLTWAHAEIDCFEYDEDELKEYHQLKNKLL